MSKRSKAGPKKDTNPKDAVGTKKVPLSVVSAPVLAEVGVAMLEGARKYGRHNYRESGVRGSVYYDATLRHLMAWWEGEDVDPDSGLNHITKAIASLTVLRDSMLRENWVDDRPPKSKLGWVKTLNDKAKDIIEKYPNAIDPFTELSITKGKEQFVEVPKEIKRILTNVLNLDKTFKEEDLNYNSDLCEFGMDRSDRNEIAMDLEELFNIQILDEDLETVQKVSDFVDLVYKYKGNL